MTDDTPILSLENVSISYFARAGEIPAVTDVSLTLRAGEAIGLVGESGCGKSTLAMAILRYLGGRGRVVAGRICYRGRDIASLSEAELRDIRGGGIGMVYQEAMSALNPSITVGEQLAEAVIYHGGGSTAQARQEVETMLKAVRLPDPGRIMAAYPHQLSGGQQQRVVIAMALLPKPDILLLDEPTTALDVTVEAGIVELIAELRARYGMTLVYISHNLGLIAQVCDRVAVMYSGEIVEEGPVATVFAKPRHPYTRGLIRCIPLPYVDRYARVLRAIPGQVTLPQERPSGCFFGPRCEHAQAGLCDVGRIALQPVRVGHAVRCVRWRDVAESPESGEARPAEQRGDDAAIAVVDLDKTYTIDDRGLWGMLTGAKPRQIKANQKLNFRARQHQTLAIVGESGCGKTTFARVLMGLETASSGEIRFEGIDLGAVSVQARAPALLRSLQMVFQNPDETLNPSFTVGAQIARAVKKLGVGRSRAEVARRTSELLELTRLPAAFAMRRPRQLSGGQKQRVSIARAFAGNPTAVVADEPVSALDVSVRAAITDLLLDIQRKQGTTLIVISHDLGFVRYIADRVVVMYLGQVMEVGTAEQLFAPPYHPYTEALLAAVPVPEADVRKRRIVLSGELPSPIDPPKGCPFHTRCHRKLGAICENEKPPDQRLADNHRIVCHIPAAELAKVEPVFTRVPPAA